MAKCDVCGDDYDKPFQVIRGGQMLTFDGFECAIHAMAPNCAHCGCRILGHGVEAGGQIYRCVHCAGHQGGTRDHAS